MKARVGVVLGLVVVPFAVSAHAQSSVWTLSQVQDQVLTKSELIQESQLGVVEAQERRTQATGTLLPQLNAVGSHYRQGAGDVLSGYSTTTGKLQASQPVFHGGAEYAALSQTKIDQTTADLDLLTARRAQLILASRQFMDTLLASKRLEYRNRDLEIYKNRVIELTNRNRIGRTRTADLDLTQSQYYSAQANIETSSANFAIELKKLARASNSTAIPQAVSRDGLPSLAEIEKSMGALADDQRLAQSRDDVLAARSRVESAEEAISISRAGHFPSADVVGNYYLFRNSTGPAYTGSGVKWDLTAQLTFPLYAGGTVSAIVRQRAAQAHRAELEADRIARDVELQVSNLRTQILSDLKSVNQLAQSVESAKRSYELIARDERSGLATNLDVIQALSQLQATEENLAVNEASLQSLYIEYQLSRSPRSAL